MRAPEILAIHPFGKMPVLRHGDVELFEIEGHRHLSRSQLPRPACVPVRSPPRRAHRAMGLARQHADGPHADPDLSPAHIAPRAADAGPDREAIEAVMPAVREQIGVLDKAVAATGLSVGDEFLRRHQSAADPLSIRASPGSAGRSPRRPISPGYYERHAARPSFARTIPPAGPPGRAKPG